jgi:hypothetical protein
MCLHTATTDFRRLFLTGATLDLLSSAKSQLPPLETLGLRNVVISDPMTIAECSPMLRHLVYESSDGHIDGNTSTLLTRLAPQLHSVSFISDIHLESLSKVPSLQARSILVNLPWTFWERFTGGTSQPIYHLRLLVTDIYENEDIFEASRRSHRHLSV